MHFKEIRIAGFKSFVDPETVPIKPGLTGIVGPNGCGKSNLLEALRWAMGATSARAMRGDEMDDLIFNGAAGRPARELAEVTLTLDNANRTAPAQFNASDEIEITRRLKRGAGSIYKVNSRTARGKDVKLIFADASTGANSPSLVRQGQISELISAKPQNRRRILEEAAGISGLNTRRHEAELKLQAAENNIERLTEVSSEVERQLESLKRQARKARKYEELSRKINAMEAFCAHLKWQLSSAEHLQARQALSDAKRSLEDLSRAAATAETRRLTQSDALQPLRTSETTASGRLGQARITLARREAERTAAVEKFTRLQSEASRLEQDIAREQAQQDDAQVQLAEARDRLAALPVADDNLNLEKEKIAEQSHRAAREKLEAAQIEADRCNGALAAQLAQNQALEANVKAHLLRRDKLTADVEKIRADQRALEQQDQQSADIEAVRQAASAAIQALDLSERELAALENDQKTIVTDEDEAKQALNAAEDKIRTIETEISGLKRLLRKHATNVAPPVLDQMRTKQGYEKAVAVALGDDLQAPTDAKAAIYWTESQADTLPLPSNAVPLTELVAAPAELARRLSMCGLVSADDGAELAARLQPGQRLVSKEGHLWRWDGFVRTPAAPTAAAERLKQQVRLEELEAEKIPLLETRNGLGVNHEQLKAKRLAHEADIQSRRRAMREQASRTEAAKADVSKATQAAERYLLKMESLADHLERTERDLNLAELTLETVNTAVDDSVIVELTATATKAKGALTLARNNEAEARGRLLDLTRNRQQALARRQAVSEDIERWSARLETSEERLQLMVKRRHETDRERLQAETLPTTLQGDLDQLAQQVASFEQARKTAADQLAIAEKNLRELENAARSASNLAISARENLAVSNARLENAAMRLAEAEAFAETHFQLKPDGLLHHAHEVFPEAELEPLELVEATRLTDQYRLDREQLGGVNMEATAEAEELSQRLDLQTEEKADLEAAIAKLRDGINALNREGRGRLIEAFDQVNAHFKSLFTTLFRGGEAELRLVDADDPLKAGLEIMAQPPGKRLGALSLMSGGEQALTATALIFAVFLSRPSPICVLDEVDAPLDDANVDRFCRMLGEMRRRTDTRFIVITHNPVTMSRMDRLFGVTMREKGVSKLVSVDLNTAEQLVAAE